MTPEERRNRGERLEGYAFTLCKAAALAFVFRRYTLLTTASGAAALYLAAARDGVTEWRCWVKPPWVVVFFALVAADEVRRIARR